MEITNRPVFREGEWSLCDRTVWQDNVSFKNLAAWGWLKDEERYLIAINFSDLPAQARIQMPWSDLRDGTWQLMDALSGTTYERDGNEMSSSGLYVELSPWNYHFFQFIRMK